MKLISIRIWFWTGTPKLVPAILLKGKFKIEKLEDFYENIQKHTLSLANCGPLNAVRGRFSSFAALSVVGFFGRLARGPVILFYACLISRCHRNYRIELKKKRFVILEPRTNSFCHKPLITTRQLIAPNGFCCVRKFYWIWLFCVAWFKHFRKCSDPH